MNDKNLASTKNTIHFTPQEVATAHQKFLMSSFDDAASAEWISMFDKDAIGEFPFGTRSGTKTSLEGTGAILHHIRERVSKIKFDRLYDVTITAGDDGDGVVIEFSGDSHFKETGISYNNRFVAAIKLKNGKVIRK
jgi:ketosteroid isomerase-like protein